jgi:hypothetical protein
MDEEETSIDETKKSEIIKTAFNAIVLIKKAQNEAMDEAESIYDDDVRIDLQKEISKIVNDKIEMIEALKDNVLEQALTEESKESACESMLLIGKSISVQLNTYVNDIQDREMWKYEAFVPNFKVSHVYEKLHNNDIKQCVPYSEAYTQLERFRYAECDEEKNKMPEFTYGACIEAFKNEICEASRYICVKEFAGDCESVTGPERICFDLIGCDSIHEYPFVMSN